MKTQELLAYRKRLLAKVHMHKTCLELKRLEAWEAYLDENFSVDSSARLSCAELNLLLDMLNNKEVKPCKIDIAGRQMIQRATKKAASWAQIQRIDELREILGWSKDELGRFIIKHLHIIANFANLSPKNASKLIYILDKIVKSKADMHRGTPF